MNAIDDENSGSENWEDVSENGEASLLTSDSEINSLSAQPPQRTGIDKNESVETVPKRIHKLSLKKTQDFNEKLRKRGVLYVARIPPRMTPTKIKTLLSDFGEVTRVFLQEEDPTKRKRRRKLTGNAAKRYTEGWVEFACKKVAKKVALSLHQQPISNHKRNPHYGDLWSVKYLSNFQWSHLTEKVAYERRVWEQKLRLETATARRETAQYKRLLETGKALDKIAERKRKRGEDSKSAKSTPTHFQLQPHDEGAGRASKKPLLDSLV